MVSTFEKKKNLTKLIIPSCSSSGNPSPSMTSPQIIQSRSHSFVGPSYEEEEEESESESESVPLCLAPKIGPSDFHIVRVIGQGSFGKVFLVRPKPHSSHPLTHGLFAMKVMRKDTIIKKNHVDYMKAERDILTKVLHPFIVQLRFSFQTTSKLYLVLDFINGGHLFFHLYRQGIFGEDQARLYTAEIVSAVSHLHSKGIVHRDLKPENILMDAHGHVMLTDFGLSKEIDELGRSNSFCGTVEYMAPEILLGKGHNKDADWWSVGILLYEMLTGKAPFIHNNRKKLQEKIIKEKVKLPPFLTSEAHSLLKGMTLGATSTRKASPGSDVDPDEESLVPDQFPASKRSQQPQSRANPIYVIKSDGSNGSTEHLIYQERVPGDVNPKKEQCVDKSASDYICKIRNKLARGV